MGAVEAGDLGFVIPHEHLNSSSSFLCTDPSVPDTPIDDIDPAELRAEPMRFISNLDMSDEPIAAAELTLFAEEGGGTLVELTPDAQLSRDPAMFRRLSAAAGVNVIMGTGFYVEAAHPAELAARPVERIAADFVRDIREGVGPDHIRAGIIGEIGTGDPLLPGEIRVLRAAALAQLETGCPINVHMAAGCRQVFAVLGILADEGITGLSRTIISHMDVAIDLGQHKEVAAAGAIVEYDTFGHEAYPDSRGYMMPTDERRVEALAEMVAAGLLDSMLVSQDVCFRHLWRRYGGYGYTNLLTRVRPMMTRAGLLADIQHRLFVANPARILAFEH